MQMIHTQLAYVSVTTYIYYLYTLSIYKVHVLCLYFCVSTLKITISSFSNILTVMLRVLYSSLFVHSTDIRLSDVM